MKVLIVDDQEDSRYLLKSMLMSCGHQVAEAVNGKVALEMLEKGAWDLVISDILMPVMDGFQLCREIRSSDRLRHLPFVFYTATYVDQKDEEFALKLGADRFIRKPLEPRAFMETVRNLEEEIVKLRGQPRRATLGDEKEILKLYNERLIHKLENKMLNLEKEMAERKRIEEALRQSEKQFRLIAENTVEVISIHDMSLRFTYISPSVARLRGYTPQEALSQSLDQVLTPQSYGLVAGLLANEMKLEASGTTDSKRSLSVELEVCRKDGTVVWTDTTLSFLRDEAHRPIGILGVSRDITERKRAEIRLQESYEKLRITMFGAINALAFMSETRDPYTAGHQKRVTQLAEAIALDMGLAEEKLEAIRVAGIVHDIGKIQVPSDLLSKPSILNDIEMNMVRSHAEAGYKIIKKIEMPWPIGDIVLQHHERMNGSGYPGGLKGEAIVFEARVLAVADVVEAMSSHRPYRPALGVDKALEEISLNKGVLYDARVVDSCLSLFRKKGFKFE